MDGWTDFFQKSINSLRLRSNHDGWTDGYMYTGVWTDGRIEGYVCMDGRMDGKKLVSFLHPLEKSKIFTDGWTDFFHKSIHSLRLRSNHDGWTDIMGICMDERTDICILVYGRTDGRI